jgi:hypothetical protein
MMFSILPLNISLLWPGEMRVQASPMISICLMVAKRFSELARNSYFDTPE